MSAFQYNMDTKHPRKTTSGGDHFQINYPEKELHDHEQKQDHNYFAQELIHYYIDNKFRDGSV